METLIWNINYNIRKSKHGSHGYNTLLYFLEGSFSEWN